VSRRTIALVLVTILTGACGYRPAARLLPSDREVSAVVPAFTSNAGYPELDVFAAENLASRLAAMGVSVVRDEGDDQLLVRGFILSAREVPLGLHAQQTTVQIELDTQVEVSQDDRDPCATSVATGLATLSIPFDANSEPERLAAMQAAVVDAIEQLVLEVMLCVRSQSDE